MRDQVADIPGGDDLSPEDSISAVIDREERRATQVPSPIGAEDVIMYESPVSRIDPNAVLQLKIDELERAVRAAKDESDQRKHECDSLREQLLKQKERSQRDMDDVIKLFSSTRTPTVASGYTHNSMTTNEQQRNPEVALSGSDHTRPHQPHSRPSKTLPSGPSGCWPIASTNSRRAPLQIRRRTRRTRRVKPCARQH